MNVPRVPLGPIVDVGDVGHGNAPHHRAAANRPDLKERRGRRLRVHVVVMPLRIIKDPVSAKKIWLLYREYGLGRFVNWLSMTHDNIDRQEVVQSLCFPETRKEAEKLVEHYRCKIEEIESMLAESESA